jgi:hypothetical protein
MEEQKKIIEEATANIKNYFNTCYELRVLQTTEKISNAGSEIISGTFITFLGMLSVLFLSLAVAFYVSFVVMGDKYSGFIMVGGLYVLLAVVLFIFKTKLLDYPIRNKIIKAIFREETLASYIPDKVDVIPDGEANKISK